MKCWNVPSLMLCATLIWVQPAQAQSSERGGGCLTA
jgi:hypothetical protein